MRLTTKHTPRLRALAAAVLIVAGLFVGSTGKAADRALLIGVGEYENSDYNLPGIDLDVDMMRKVARIMGFEERHTKVLLDEEATRANVERTLEDWIIDGVSSSDRVLIYYSGHGTQVPDTSGDESDGADEAITMHDLKVEGRGRRASLEEGALVDDRFHEVLSGTPSEEVLVLVDACHSGTFDKSIRLAGREFGVSSARAKFFSYGGMPRASDRGFAAVERQASEREASNYVSITAAADDQDSLATNRGSYFTLAIKEAIETANGDDRRITPRDLAQYAEDYIEEKLASTRHKIFHPQLNGSEALASKAIRLVGASLEDGPVRERLRRLAEKHPALPLSANRSSFRVGDKLVLTVDAPRDGYLNVVSVDANDEATVLFPNQWRRESRVREGQLKLPTRDMAFDLVATKPVGSAMIFAFLTKSPINLFEEGEGRRNKAGAILEPFAELSAFSAARAFEPKARSGGARAAALELEVTP